MYISQKKLVALVTSFLFDVYICYVFLQHYIIQTLKKYDTSNFKHKSDLV